MADHQDPLACGCEVVLDAPAESHPTMLRRLGRVQALTLLLWGASDRIVTPAYGAAYANAFGNGRLEVIPEAGHLPQIERPEATYALIDAHLRQTGTRSVNTE